MRSYICENLRNLRENFQTMKRRQFILNTALTSAGVATLGSNSFAFSGEKDFPTVRIAPEKRKFTSKAVEDTIVRMKSKIKDKELAWMFENCFPNTIDTTVDYSIKDGRPDTFVITGDIDAMWLRDSTAQVWPYLDLVSQDEKLKLMIAGLINRQTECILIDPYANAFYKTPRQSEWTKDHTDMKPMLHERKWELDSLCYTIRLAYHYWKKTGDSSPFDTKWAEANRLIMQTCREQQRKDGRGPYSFGRTTAWSTDTVPGNGFGTPVKFTGLICSTFRPSDDATVFLYFIPSNYFALNSFRQMAEMSRVILKDETLAGQWTAFANELEVALKQHATYHHPKYGWIYAFEVDGFGNHLLMDDAGIPGLHAMPYLGSMPVEDSIYQNTRKFIFSEDNPYFFKGRAGEGLGSPHTLIDNIWPMGIISRILTSTDNTEILFQLKTLKQTHANTGFIHESFNKHDPTKYSRSWFAWVNTLFGEAVLKLEKERPGLLERSLGN